MSAYSQFIDRKAQSATFDGFDPVFVPDFLFDFQRELVTWATRKGKAAIFADCGLGKTPMQLVWAENVVRKTNRPVLILTPLAVSHQTLAEAEKFCIEAHRSHAGEVHDGINVANYERLHRFKPEDFAGCVCDESSILKSFDGKRRGEITEFMRKLPYRLLCTATAAPNDYVELGTSSEALGELGHMDMLARFFKNDQNSIKPTVYRHHGQDFKKLEDANKWRFKGHAEMPFWRWVCSWARALRRPSDLGFDDDLFVLPPLVERDYLVEARTIADGMLFSLPAVGLREQRDERRRTIRERCDKVAWLVDARDDCSLVWCHLNAEGDLLETLIPHSIQVKGSDSDEWKETAAAWFEGRQCVCRNPLFSAKLSAWRNYSNAQIQNICAPITAQIEGNGSVAERNATRLTRGAESATQKIQQNGKENSTKSRSTENGTQKRASLEHSINTASASRPIASSLNEDAQSVAGKPMSISGASSDSTSTIAIHQETSEGSCVPPATSASANSETIRCALNELRCICGHKSGKRVLISKPVMFGYGLNFQHCSHVTFFPSHSFEQYYQGVRRCWRFGQKSAVRVDVVTTEGEKSVLQNLQRKAAAADLMFSNLIAEMHRSETVGRDQKFAHAEEVPAWL